MSTTTTARTTTHLSTAPIMTPDSSILATKGTLLLRHMLPRDYPAYERINDTAFATSLKSLFFPDGKTDGDRAWSRRVFDLHMTRDAHYMSHLTCVDTSAPPLSSDLAPLSAADRTAAEAEGRVVGISVWKIRKHDRTPEELAEEETISDADGYPPSGKVDVFDDFVGKISACKSKHLGGRKHVLLHLLATDPDYHRRGIGGLHLGWGLGEADRYGLMGYLEGSEEGRPLYERWGFEAVERLPFDAVKHGAKQDMVYMIMVRPAKAH